MTTSLGLPSRLRPARPVAEFSRWVRSSVIGCPAGGVALAAGSETYLPVPRELGRIGRTRRQGTLARAQSWLG